MVLFKRKPVQYVSPPQDVESEEAEVWLIPQTGEYFATYEAYLDRTEFYKQRRFICQITGHSGLTFYEALKSETDGAREVEEAFPEALKGPVLRSVQFSTISRIDNLVDHIFEEFKKDYFPGEAVTVNVLGGQRLTGIVREVTKFGGRPQPDGTMGKGFVRYYVSLDNRPMEEAVVDENHIMRDRKIFTKQILRSFIKKTVTREAWTGAPWIVKPEVAQQYHIDTRVPPHLKYESKVAEKKHNLALKKNSNGTDFDGMVGSFPGTAPGQRLLEIKPAPKSHKGKQQQGPKMKQLPLTFLSVQPNQPPPHGYHFQHPPPPHFVPPPHFMHNGVPLGPHFQGYQMPLQAMPAPPPPPPVIKYPIEDLQIAPRKENVIVRPPLKFFSQDTPVPIENSPSEGNGILMESVGPLLETWDTLNVYCEVFKLDSFTFDDFVEAMQFTSEDVDCELFVEVHCAVLKQLVGVEADGGKIMVQLPEMDEEEEEEEEGEDEEEERIPTPEPEPSSLRRTTRSSLAKAEAANLKAESPVSDEPKVTHRGAEMQADDNWIERLKKRDFKNGGWEIVMVGLLNQLSKDPRYTKNCTELLEHLAPLDMEPTAATAKQQYAALDINLRIKALQIICMLTAETKAIRGYMEECSEEMTSLRKKKIIWQRDRKAALEELRLLHERRKILLPDNMPPSPSPEPAKLNGFDAAPKAEEIDENETEEAEDSIPDSDEDAHPGRSLRRGNHRAEERKRKRDAIEAERAAKAEAAAKLPKQSKEFTKLLKDIAKKQEFVKECEEEIATIDNDLREADCPRTRVLGKDRFWNRYYWFERNGMPYGGLPDSSTADAGYANGCVWVQGPDELEREGYIDMKAEWQEEYVAKFEVSVPERKKREEGETSVFDARQWGFYDEPETVERLIEWLDPRGVNELKLQKELKNYRDKIVLHMEKRQQYLHPEQAQKDDEKDEAAAAAAESPPQKRMSTRTKHHPEKSATATELSNVHRCLNWRNYAAIEALGHLHSDQPRPRKARGKAEKVIEKVIAEERETRSETRGRKGGGRQGGRYGF